MSIPIFTVELNDGVADKVRATASICYASVLETVNHDKLTEFLSKKQEQIFNALATNQNQPDLHYLKSILATAGWNKNDDVFDAMEMWLARHTAEDKPFNIEHDPRQVRGHITGNYAINEENEVISDTSTIDELPNKYHVVTSAVLYKFLNSPDPTLEEEMQNIITEIGKGEWFVSMEALFTNFDYAISSADGKTNIIKRDEKSAFLTKHLRAYGGVGKYQDFKLGRVMRNITFSGKGLVRKPANEESIIFQNIATFKNTNTLTMGYENVSKEIINKESVLMATEIELAQARIKSLEDSLVTASNQNKDLDKRLQETSEKQVQVKMTELDTQIKNKDEKITALASQVKTEQDARTGAEAKLKETSDKLSVFEIELNKIKSENIKVSRVSAWASHTGSDLAVAAKSVEKLSKLDDEEFKEFLLNQPTKAAPIKDTAQAAASAVLDNVQSTDKTAPLASDGVNSGVEVAQAALSEFLGKNFLGKSGKITKNKNKE